MTFQEYSVSSRNLIEENLKQFLQIQKEEIPLPLQKQGIVNSLEEFVLKGKLIRGTLFLLTVELLGQKITEDHIHIACAIELIHSSLLIQDDIIDNDYIRRGGKTMFAFYEEKGKSLGATEAKHYGISIAMMVADVSFYLAMELISKNESKSVGKIISYLSQEIKTVALAEGIDSEFGQTPEEATIDEIYSVYKYKTARYTFSLPFILACIVSQKDESIKKEFEELGEHIGTIFQIKDDLIGILGDEDVIGKPVGSDIRENKKTLIRALLYEKVVDSERKILIEAFGNRDLAVDQLNSIRDLIFKYRIVESLDKEIENIMVNAWRIFNNMEGEKHHKEILKNLLEFNLRRTA